MLDGDLRILYRCLDLPTPWWPSHSGRVLAVWTYSRWTHVAKVTELSTKGSWVIRLMTAGWSYSGLLISPTSGDFFKSEAFLRWFRNSDQLSLWHTGIHVVTSKLNHNHRWSKMQTSAFLLALLVSNGFGASSPWNKWRLLISINQIKEKLDRPTDRRSLKARSHCTCFTVMKQDETGQWNTMKQSDETPWNSNETAWNSAVKHRETAWNSMKHQWNSMKQRSETPWTKNQYKKSISLWSPSLIQGVSLAWNSVFHDHETHCFILIQDVRDHETLFHPDFKVFHDNVSSILI